MALFPRTAAVWLARPLVWFADGWVGTNRTASFNIKIRFPVGLFRFFGFVWAAIFLITGSNSPTVLGTGFAVLSGLALLCFAYFQVCEDPRERLAVAVAGRAFFISAVLMIVVTANASLLQSFWPEAVEGWSGWYYMAAATIVFPLGVVAAKVAVDAVADLVMTFLGENDEAHGSEKPETSLAPAEDAELRPH